MKKYDKTRKELEKRKNCDTITEKLYLFDAAEIEVK